MTVSPSRRIPTGPYQLMPDLTDDEFETLKSDIAKNGVIVPIVLDDMGNVLDGHNRLACIAQLEFETPNLKIPYSTEIRKGLNDASKREIVISLNLKRRHLSHEQRLNLLVALRKSGKSLNEVAEAAGMSRTSVFRALADAEDAGIDTQPAYVLAKDGRLMPSSYAVPSFMSYKEMVREDRIEARAIERSAPVPDFTLDASMDIFAGDIRDTDAIIERIGRGTVDAIISDPPYPREFVPLMEDLSRLAAAVLKPGRPLVAMLGHAYLPEYIELLSKHLKYHWIMADVLGGANSVQHIWSAFVGWKPMLVFTNGPAQLPYYFLDLVRSPGPDKDFHVWGQDVKTFEYLIYRFTRPKDRVLDPFLGGGTTGVAALRMKREFVGFDNDPEAVATSMRRFSELDVGTFGVDMDPEARPELPVDGDGA